MRRVHPEAEPLSEAHQLRLDELGERYNALCDGDDGEHSDDIAAKLQALDAEIEALTGREQYRPEHIAMAGVFVSLNHDGELRIERGRVRADDWPKAETPDSDDEQTETDRPKILSEKLAAELTAYRTAGLRNEWPNIRQQP
jgi:ParB family chromosome partitioning protein